MSVFLLFLCIISLALCLNSFRNYFLLRTPVQALEGTPKISVLIPARNEEDSIAKLIKSLQAQTYSQFEVRILDDDSSDETFHVSLDAIGVDDRFHVQRSRDSIPQGWLGKAWACQRLANSAEGDIFCFIDADVTLAPDALYASLQLMQSLDVDVLCPYPRQVTFTVLSRIVQPLLQWSWMTSLPLDLALKSPRPSLSAGNGQLLLITREKYVQIKGHESVKSEILEDIELVKVVKQSGGKGGVWDGSTFAECTMYTTNSELIEGYAKSMWQAFGSIPRGLFIAFSLLVLYLSPFVGLFSNDSLSQVLALVAILSSLLNRLLVHVHFHYRPLDALLYPLSFLAFAALMIISSARKRRGLLSWKERAING